MFYLNKKYYGFQNYYRMLEHPATVLSCLTVEGKKISVDERPFLYNVSTINLFIKSILK